MSLIENLTEQLRRDEGEVLHAYTDHLGYWTIGIGRLIDKREDCWDFVRRYHGKCCCRRWH